MALYTVDGIQTLLSGTPQANASVALLDMIGQAVDRVAKEWIGQEIEQQVRTEYYDGQGTRYLVLKQRPLQCPVLTGNTTANGSTIAGLSSTANLFVGNSVVGSGIPSGAYVTALTSTTATLSVPATLTATGTMLNFYPAVWEDANGNYGATPGGFDPVSSRLLAGTNYAPVLDYTLPGTSSLVSRSGMLERIGSVWSTSIRRGLPVWWANDIGPLTLERTPSLGAFKVQYLAGYPVVPLDLTFAVNQLAVRMIRQAPFGQALQSENLGQYSYQLAQKVQGTPELGSVQQILGRMYREVSI